VRTTNPAKAKSIEVTDKVIFPDATEQTTAAESLPSGVIAMWHGTIANIPTGWIVCDGNNFTPNLLTRFIEGVASAVTNPGATGGATSKTTSGHNHLAITNPANGGSDTRYLITSEYPSDTKTDSISDIRPLFYDVAFIMKT